MPRIPRRLEQLAEIDYRDRTVEPPRRVRGEQAQQMRRQGYPTGSEVCACEECWQEWLSNTPQEPVRNGHAARWFVQLVNLHGLATGQGRPRWFYTRGQNAVNPGYTRHSTESTPPWNSWNQSRHGLSQEQTNDRIHQEMQQNAVYPAHTAAPNREFADIDFSTFIEPRFGPMVTEGDGWSREDIENEEQHRARRLRTERRAFAELQRAQRREQELVRRRLEERQQRSLRRADRELETHMDESLGSLINPFENLLPKGGKVWSAEVEINVLTPGEAATALGVETGSYSIRPDVPSVVTASDSSVDAEVKVSCMRDGAAHHAEYAQRTYRLLREEGAEVRANCGHHVHIDATRAVDAGLDAVINVGWAASRMGRMITPALLPLCSSGYSRHRGYNAENRFVQERNHLISKGWALHAARAMAQAQRRNLAYSGATFEFRMPNGTLEALRAHAYVAIGMSLIDFGERFALDAEPAAVQSMAMIDDWLDHARVPEVGFAARFMHEHLALSDDSLMAITATVCSAPTSAAHKRVWTDRAPRGVPSVLNTREG